MDLKKAIDQSTYDAAYKEESGMWYSVYSDAVGLYEFSIGRLGFPSSGYHPGRPLEVIVEVFG